MAKKLATGQRGSTGVIVPGAARTIAHGVGSAPTVVLATPKSTGASDVFINNITATDFDITFAAGGNIDFYFVAFK